MERKSDDEAERRKKDGGLAPLDGGAGERLRSEDDETGHCQSHVDGIDAHELFEEAARRKTGPASVQEKVRIDERPEGVLVGEIAESQRERREEAGRLKGGESDSPRVGDVNPRIEEEPEDDEREPGADEEHLLGEHRGRAEKDPAREKARGGAGRSCDLTPQSQEPEMDGGDEERGRRHRGPHLEALREKKSSVGEE